MKSAARYTGGSTPLRVKLMVMGDDDVAGDASWTDAMIRRDSGLSGVGKS